MPPPAGGKIRIKGLRYLRHGAPAEVLALEEYELPPPGPGQALVGMRAAGIHYSDLGVITGTYGRLPELPALAGRDGVGEVLQLGPDTSGPPAGSIVRMPEEPGVWRDALVADAASLYVVPQDVPLEQAGQAFINPPTAFRLLADFVALQAGDWVVQNAGASAVGLMVAQLARHRGVNVLSIVRDPLDEPRLRAGGAAAVAGELSGYEQDPLALTGGVAPKLALNAIGGESALRLCRAVGPGGTVVTYGAVTSEPVRFPTRALIFNDITLRGFWLDRWLRRQTPEAAKAFLDEVLGLLRDGVLVQPVAGLYPLRDWRIALDHAFRGDREGKILFRGDWRR